MFLSYHWSNKSCMYLFSSKHSIILIAYLLSLGKRNNHNFSNFVIRGRYIYGKMNFVWQWNQQIVYIANKIHRIQQNKLVIDGFQHQSIICANVSILECQFTISWNMEIVTNLSTTIHCYIFPPSIAVVYHSFWKLFMLYDFQISSPDKIKNKSV